MFKNNELIDHVKLFKVKAVGYLDHLLYFTSSVGLKLIDPYKKAPKCFLMKNIRSNLLIDTNPCCRATKQ